MSERRTAEEKYLVATQASDLTVDPDQQTDADKLLAAAYAVGGDARKTLALDVYRIRATQGMNGAHGVAERLAILARGKMMRRPGARGRSDVAKAAKLVVLTDVAMMVLKWWQRQACPACHGRGHPEVPGTSRIDDSRECGECGGTGKIKLERLVKPEMAEIARWMASEMEGLSSMVFDDMAKLMKNSLDL